MSQDRKYPSLKPDAISEKCFKALAAWIPLAGSSVTETERYQIANNILMHTVRFLYDFFDDNKIYVSINYRMIEDNFAWSINDISSFSASDRITAEEEAFIAAFKKLEETL